jgi:hypothetical protein
MAAAVEHSVDTEPFRAEVPNEDLAELRRSVR